MTWKISSQIDDHYYSLTFRFLQLTEHEVLTKNRHVTRPKIPSAEHSLYRKTGVLVKITTLYFLPENGFFGKKKKKNNVPMILSISIKIVSKSSRVNRYSDFSVRLWLIFDFCQTHAGRRRDKTSITEFRYFPGICTIFDGLNRKKKNIKKKIQHAQSNGVRTFDRGLRLLFGILMNKHLYRILFPRNIMRWRNRTRIRSTPMCD